jgi:glutamine---fructose-6-phosphate transaminase (isomerizing)
LRLSLHDQVEHHKIKTIIEEGIKVSLPPGVPHYYIMEMLEQPEAVARSLNYGARLMGGENMVKLGGLDRNREELVQIDNLIIAACGTSYLAGKYGEYLMRELGCFKYVESMFASEINERDFPKQYGGFLSISQSGETMDLLIPFRLAQKHGLSRINVVNKVNSTLARENECGCFLNCGREFSVASTKAFVCQVTVMALIAVWFAQFKNFNATKKMRAYMMNELKMLSTNLKKTLENVNEKSQEIVQQIKGCRHIFFCGEGIADCVAKEGALKMKELTYLHCQSISLSNLGNSFYCYFKKHKDTPLIIIILDCQKRKMEMIEQIETLHQDVGFMPIIVTDIKDQGLRERLSTFANGRLLQVQRSGTKYDGFTLSALVCVIPLQRLAYDLTIALGYHPDRPRNLAKELTT